MTIALDLGELEEIRKKVIDYINLELTKKNQIGELEEFLEKLDSNIQKEKQIIKLIKY